MRMVFTDASEATFISGKERLLAAFDRWAEQQGRAVDPFIIEVLLEHRWKWGNGILGRWRPDQLHGVLEDWFPAKISIGPQDWPQVIPTVHAFIDFLHSEGLADELCAPAEQLHQAVDKLRNEFDQAMADERRYSLAKFWVMRMIAAGIDVSDPEATQEYAQAVRDGRVEVDQRMIQQALANHLDRDDERPRTLPLALIDPPDVLAERADGAVTIRRLREFVVLLGTGRKLTATGRLRLNDAAELIAKLGLSDVINPRIGNRTFKTTSSEDLRHLMLLFELARKTRVARVVKGQLVPVKSATKILNEPAVLAQRIFDALLELGDVVLPDRPIQSLLAWELHDVALTVMTAMHVAPTPLDRNEIDEIVLGCVGEEIAFSSIARTTQMRAQRASGETTLLLNELADLGILKLVDDEVALTGLGTAVLLEHLRADGFVIPAIDDLLDETAEVVVAQIIRISPEHRHEVLSRWRNHNPSAARAQLRALAGRTDDPEHRALAEAYA